MNKYNDDDNKEDDDGSFSRIDIGEDANELTCEATEESKQMVEVQLPPDFGVSSSVPVPSSSLSGSMLGFADSAKQQPPLTGRKTADHEREASEWSVIASTTTGPPQDDSSVAASSAISGFDIISLNGSSKKRCNFCSFLNHEDDAICKGCDKALVANPCPTIDEKLALDLQRQEEEAAFKNFQEEEDRRNHVSQQPLLIRAQMLADDILSALEGCRRSIKIDNAFSGLPPTSLTFLASSFLECMDRQMKGNYEYAQHALFTSGNIEQSLFQIEGLKHRGLSSTPMPLRLCYCFTKNNPTTMEQIHVDGFGPNAEFGSTPEAAPPIFGGNIAQRQRPWSSSLNRHHGLSSILEHDDDLEESIPPGIIIEEYDSVNPLRPGTHKGWIAAIINDPSFGSSTVLVNNGTATIFSQPEGVQALPLVSFDATRLLGRDGNGDDLVWHLTDSLTGVFQDFFYRY